MADLVHIFLNPRHFLFTVETIAPGHRSPDSLVKCAIDIMLSKCAHYLVVVERPDFVSNALSGSGDDRDLEDAQVSSFLCLPWFTATRLPLCGIYYDMVLLNEVVVQSLAIIEHQIHEADFIYLTDSKFYENPFFISCTRRIYLPSHHFSIPLH